MKLVCSPSACPDLLLPAFLEFARSAGFDHVELFRDRTESTPVHPNLSVRMVRDHFDRSGLRLTGLTIRDLTGRKADSDERNLPYNLRQLEWDIHLGRALGVQSLHLKGGARTGEALEDLIAGVNELLERVPDVSLYLGSAPGNRLQGLADYRAAMPGLPQRARILLETGSLLSAGEDPLRLVETFAGCIGRVHLRDQRGARPVPFGEGELALADLLKLLTASGYDGCLVIGPQPPAGVGRLEAVAAARRFVEELLSTF